VFEENGHAFRKAKDLRNAVVPFPEPCRQQQHFADPEIGRIEKRREFLARVQGELERYVVQVIEQCATPDRRGIKRPEGNVSAGRRTSLRRVTLSPKTPPNETGKSSFVKFI